MKQLKITQKITLRDADSVQSYFKDVNKVDLITPEEEVELAKKIKKGDEKALERLVKANLRFVISVAKQYQHYGIPFEDLINEGNLGLITAAKRFDETRGFKFISYAVWWIRQSILQAIADNARLIRVPSNQVNTVSKIKKTASKLQQKLEREPTISEISKELGEDEYKIKNILQSTESHISSDDPIKDDENRTLSDLLTSPEDTTVEKTFNQESLVFDLEKVMNKLNDREKSVLCMYFGILGYQAMTLEEIGEYFELTRERVRQIKDKSLLKLRSRDNSKILKQYLNHNM